MVLEVGLDSLERVQTKKPFRAVVLEVGLDSKNESVFFSTFVKCGAGSRTRTYEARRREIYSLLSLPLDDSSTAPIIPHNI